jgi:hypothetical protein
MTSNLFATIRKAMAETIGSHKFTTRCSKHKLLLLFFCAMVALCAVTPTAFGQQNAHKLRAYTWVKPATGMNTVAIKFAAKNRNTLPLFTYTITSSRDGNSYSGVMVGQSPFGGGPKKANITTQIVPLIIVTNTVGVSVDNAGIISTTPGVTTFDPTVADTSCLTAPNDVPLTLVQQSPIIQSTNFSFGGTFVGNTQYIDAFQRANFFAFMKGNSYHTKLSPVKTLAPILVNIPAASGLALATTALGPPPFCGPLGIMDINVFDPIVSAQIIPALAAQGVNPTTFPIFLLSNVVMSFGSPTNLNACCVIGYHGANGTQTYSPADFDTTTLFPPAIEDTGILAHEVGEWMDDPFGTNSTPPWGHIGQQPGCQNNLEVGDPLTGTGIPPVTMPNGFTYDLQELVFFSWFYGAPSIGVNGWFSDNGTFLTDAGPPCQ